MKKAIALEKQDEHTWMDVFEGESFGVLCDRFIRVLLILTAGVGIPYTMYLLLQLLSL